jgi:hypothetical protein
MNHLDSFDITTTTTTTMMRERIMELQYNGHYIESIEPLQNGKVQIIAKVLRPGMTEQKWTEIDFKKFWINRREIMANRNEEKK